MSTDIETEEPPRAACPACGEITLAIGTIPRTRWWAPLTRYSCVSDGCGYTHTIEHL